MTPRTNPAVLLPDDWFCVELHIMDRLKAKLLPAPKGEAVAGEPFLANVIGESASRPNSRGYPCPGVSPIAIVAYSGSPIEQERPSVEHAGESQLQEVTVWIGGKLSGNDCNAESARRLIGPIISRLQGWDAVVEDYAQTRPERVGILHGWQPTSQHQPLYLQEGPNPVPRRPDDDHIFYELVYRTIVSFRATDDAEFC